MDKISKIIYLDMDDVVCDFANQAIRLFIPEGVMPEISTWDIEGMLGITREEFEQKVKEQGINFWRYLPEYPDFKRLYKELYNRYEKVIFLSDPYISPAAATGKVLWLQDRFGGDFKNYILTPQKYLLANRNAILIDDSDNNVIQFSCLSGHVILYPQAWNKQGKLQEGEDTVQFILNQLAVIEVNT